MHDKDDWELPQTDLARWRLDVDEGRHHWRYVSEEESVGRPQSVAEKLFLGLETGAPQLPEPSSYMDAARNGLQFYQLLQLEDGHWGCDYGGPSFLLPGIIFAMYISGTEIPKEWRTEITRYLGNIANDDGGWGLHLEGDSTVFATTCYYIVLRIFGLEKEHPLVVKARDRIHTLGSAVGIPQWGKVWLATLNLFPWDGINPILPEFWLLPDWIPFHPWRWWIQCRVVYLPVSYLYSNRCKIPLNPLLKSLREEIYLQPFDTIDFTKHRNTVAASDLKHPHTPLLRLANTVLTFWETYLRPNFLQRWSNECIYDLIQREDENTNYNCLAPVNKALHMASVYFSDGPNSTRLEKHRHAIVPYLWQSGIGMTSGGTNGVQVWDTAFSIQAASEAGLASDPMFRKTMEKALKFLDISQLRDDLKDPYRQERKGGWPFSTRDNGYIVSDCSAEAMKAVIMLQQEYGFHELIPRSRLEDCVDTLLKMQNSDGGYASYERVRGSQLLEKINPAEIFDRIMVEYSYPECTTAVLTSLSLFHRHFPDYRPDDIKQVVSRAAEYIRHSQRTDGSWYGSWAICFTYATFFALESLELVGETFQTSERVRRACKWLVGKQMEDGGWGEHYTSCEKWEYIQHEKSQIVNTCWAVLGLMHARYPDRTVVEKGLKVGLAFAIPIWCLSFLSLTAEGQLILSRQQPTGEWLQEGIEGVFNGTCTIGYPNYKYYFPIWAMGRYTRVYLPLLEELKPKKH